MSEAIAWTLLALLILGAERRWGNLSAPAHLSAAARASDEAMILSTALVLVGPVLQQLVWPRVVAMWEVILGILLCVFGIVLRIAAMKALKGRYRLSPAVQPDLPILVSTGCYGTVRNPGYSGLLLSFLGLAVVAAGWPGTAWSVPMVLLLAVRIHVEERFLATEFGAAHDDYCSVVPWRLVPHVY